MFEKYSNMKFHENWSSGSRVVPCGQTYGHEANRRFCERAYKRNALRDDHIRPSVCQFDTVSATNPSVRFGEKESEDDDMHDTYTVRLQYTGI
jgi:hypothetical protein